MKKSISLLLSIALAFVCLMAVVNASGLKNEVNDVLAKPGETVTFTATLSEAVSVKSGAVSLQYDKTVLKPISGTWNIEGSVNTFDMSTEKGVFLFTEQKEIKGTVFTAVFEVLKTAPDGNTSVSLDIRLDNDKTAITNENGTMTVVEGAVIPETEISAFNLSFNDSVYIKIYAWDIKGYDVKMLVWNEAQENYTLGTEDALLKPVGSQTVSGKKNQVFDYNGLAAKQMADTVYFRSYAEVDGEIVYSAVKKYSILQYVYNKLGKTGTATTDENLKTLLADMLTYGASAQRYFKYNTDRLATADFYQVKVVGGLLSDGCNNGMYLPLDKVTLIAPQTNADGKDFLRWENSSGTKVSETASFELTVTEQNETYTAIYGDRETPEDGDDSDTPSEGLSYVLNPDGESYSVSGTQNRNDKKLVIPCTYEGKPVTGIGDSAFFGYKWITSIVIPDSVISIGENAFYYTGYYENEANWTDGVLYIGNHLITAQNDKIPSNYAIKEGTTCIADSAFDECTRLMTIEIPDSVTSVGKRAFHKCKWMTSVEMPSGLTNVSIYIFHSCESLTSIELPDNLTSIDEGMFFVCRSLESITIGNSVTSIGAWAFYDCDNLTSIHFNGTKAEWNAISKGNYWNFNTGKYNIHCTDGTLSK